MDICREWSREKWIYSAKP